MSKSGPDATPLFKPLQIGSLKLKNRVVMAPMTRTAAPDGVPTQANADYYRRRAEGDIGLILTEGAVVNRPASRNEKDIPVFHGEAALAGWRTVADSVHAVGGHIGPQLWHTGSSPGQTGWEPEAPVESPSGLLDHKTKRGVAMTEEDIADTIDAFAQAAADAETLGFDMAELHGAHSYLIDQFFWDKTNVRDDRWGGSTLMKRTRFAVEIVKAIRRKVRPDFPIFMRLSQWKLSDFTAKLASTPDEMESWLTPLADAGVDVFHCSQRRFWEPEFPEIDGDLGLNFAGWAKKLTGKATVSVGSVGLSQDFFSSFQGQSSEHVSIDALFERMDKDEFDLIAVGRALITDPFWLDKVRRGANSELKGFHPSDLQSLI